mgnify:CR=1 FL=1
MALTIAVCVGSFVIIYAQVDPFTRDFIAAPATATPTPKPKDEKADTAQSGAASSGNSASNDSAAAAEPTATAEPAPPTPTPNEFTADYRSNDETAVNFRSGPTTDSDVLQLLDAGTPMQSTGKKETDDGGTVWMEFKLQNGTTGWIREIDAIPAS